MSAAVAATSGNVVSSFRVDASCLSTKTSRNRVATGNVIAAASGSVVFSFRVCIDASSNLSTSDLTPAGLRIFVFRLGSVYTTFLVRSRSARRGMLVM